MKRFVTLMRAAYESWSNHKAARLGAALAYYTMLSLAPLLIIAIATAGIFFGRDAAQGQISAQIKDTVGASAASSIQDMVVHAAKPGTSTVATIIGIVTLVLGAAGVFGQLQDAMNTIWDVPPAKSGGIALFIRDRLISFSMVLGTCFLLLVSLVISAGLAALSNFALRGADMSGVLQAINLVVGTGIIALLFALLFKFLPDAEVAWHDVWIGAGFTAVLFSLGKFLLGLYLGRSGIMSAYGAAGALIVILTWVYYAAQIFFFGAEVTKVYANTYGSHIEPTHDHVDNSETADGSPKLRLML